MTARWAVRAATWPARRQVESLLLRQRNGITFRCDTIFILYITIVAESDNNYDWLSF